MSEPYIEPQIDQVARRIWQAYKDRKNVAVRGGYKKSGRHDDMGIYRKAAALAIKLQADPVDFVAACFEGCRMKNGPFANMLHGNAAEAWYKQYLTNHGMTAGKVQVGAKEDGTPIYDVQYVCDVDLRMDLDLAASLFWHNTGDEDHRNPKNQAILNDAFYELPITARALLGSEVTWAKFGQEIHTFFSEHPNYLEAARRLKAPIDTILTWIRSQLILTK